MIILIALFVASYAASILYIYRFRGTERYSHFGEYIRKGWPIFAPFNCLLYTQTKSEARKPLMSAELLAELKILQDNWQVIREEAIAIRESQQFDKARNPDSVAYYDIGFRTFFKRGWSKFYLSWYGYTHDSAKRLCPKTIELVSQLKCVNGAMFSILPPGGELTRHLDPFACSFRYHLGLDTPNCESCFIDIDNNKQSWRDGEAFMFDETYIHYAQNNSDCDRLILMCDVERPMGFVGRFFNRVYKLAMRLMIVPNTEEDRRGVGSRIFSNLNAFFAASKKLKQTNRPLYKVVKFVFNSVLAALIIGLFYLPFYLFS